MQRVDLFVAQLGTQVRLAQLPYVRKFLVGGRLQELLLRSLGGGGVYVVHRVARNRDDHVGVRAPHLPQVEVGRE